MTAADRVRRRRFAAGALALAAVLVAAATQPAGRAAAACIPARQLWQVDEAGGKPFRQPADIVLSGDRLLVLDDLNRRVAVLDEQGRSAGALALPGAEGSSWIGIGFGGADQVFLASPSEGRISVIDLKGRPVREFPIAEAGAPARPAGVLVSRASVFVADNAAHKVRVFTLDGRPTVSWGGVGDGPAQFRAPFRLAEDSSARVLVTDALNSRVLAFTPKGEPLAAFGEFGTTEGTLFRPAGLAVLEGDRVIVADNYYGSLQVFDARGAYQGVLCSGDGRPLALENPTGLAARGRVVYVVEMGAGRVGAWETGLR